MRWEKLLETETVKQEEPELDDLGSSQPVQTVEDASIRRLAAGKACFGEKPEGMAEETKPVAHGCARPPHRSRAQGRDSPISQRESPE